MIYLVILCLFDHSIATAVPFEHVFKIENRVKLENRNSESTAGEIAQVILWKKWLIILTRNQEFPVKVFDKNGKFVKNLLRTGSGPREYQRADKISVSDTYIYILDNLRKNVLRVDNELQFVDARSIEKLTHGKIHSAYGLVTTNDDLLIFSQLFPFQPKNAVCITNAIGSFFSFSVEDECNNLNSGGIVLAKNQLYFLSCISDEIQHGTLIDGQIKKEQKKKIGKPVWPVITTSRFRSLSDKYGFDKALDKVGSELAPAFAVVSLQDWIVINYQYFLLAWNTVTDKIIPIQMDKGFYLPLVGTSNDSLLYIQEAENFNDNPEVIFYKIQPRKLK